MSETSTAWWRTPRARTFMRYTLASGISVAAGQTTLALTFGVARWPAAAANVAAFVVGGVLSYALNRRWTWRRTGRSHLLREVAPFWTIAVVGLLASTAAAHAAAHVGARLTSRFAQTLAVMAASLGAYAFLWVAKFVILDRYIWDVSSAATDRSPSTRLPPPRGPI